MTDIVQSIMQNFSDFTSGTRVLMLIDRGIGNTNKGSRRWLNKLISTDSETFERNIHELISQQQFMNNPDLRLYGCVNSRKFERGIISFQHKMIDLATKDEKNDFYRRLNDNFCSALMKPENRKENYFLLDYDAHDGDDFYSCIIQIGVIVKLKYRTPNGWHFITEPFNPILTHHLITLESIKKDALLLLHTLEPQK